MRRFYRVGFFCAEQTRINFFAVNVMTYGFSKLCGYELFVEAPEFGVTRSAICRTTRSFLCLRGSWTRYHDENFLSCFPRRTLFRLECQKYFSNEFPRFLVSKCPINSALNCRKCDGRQARWTDYEETRAFIRFR